MAPEEHHQRNPATELEYPEQPKYPQADPKSEPWKPQLCLCSAADVLPQYLLLMLAAAIQSSYGDTEKKKDSGVFPVNPAPS